MAGRFEQGFEYALRATELDPLSAYSHYNIGSGLYYARRFREALEQHQKVVDEFPEYGLGYYGLAKVQRYLGEVELATENNNIALEMLDRGTLVQIAVAESFAAAGKRSEAFEKLQELDEIAAQRFVSPYMLAMVYSFLRDDEKVLDHLERSLDAKEAWLCCLPVEARFENYFQNERFQQILRKIEHPMAGKLSHGNLGTEVTREFGDLSTILIDDTI
jgi:tetratricopeptide (TPR) repeat protein